MSIVFQKIRYKNLLSAGNTFTEIDLESDRTTLIVGENGSGKSTVLDAITFALYGKPFRKINLPQLVNGFNKKDTLVELEFKTGKDRYKIRRGINPKIFEIIKNGKLTNQSGRDYQKEFEENVLKMNLKSFGQIVILGKSTFIPFMQMTSAHRREVIEDILDLQMFSVLGSMVKDKINKNKEDANELKFSYELNKSKLESAVQFNSSIKKMRQDEKQNIADKIEAFTQQINDISSKISNHKYLTVDVDKFKTKKKSLSDKINMIQSNIREIDGLIKTNQKNIDFYDHNQNCPTCRQQITADFKDVTTTKFKDQLDQFNDVRNKLSGRLEELSARLVDVSTAETNINKWSRDYEMLQMSKNATEQNIQSLKKDLEKVEEADVQTVDTTQFKQIEKTLTNQIKKNIEQREVFAVLNSMLKDGGLKSQLINQFIPVMNKLLNQYLHNMEFYIDFQIDSNFNEKIVSRFKEDFSYESFSEGEKARIDLALLLTWRAVAKMRNSASTNLLIMDEIFDGSLDSEGVDNLRKILSTITGCNIIIISHNVDVKYSEFDRVLKFSKLKNFSIMEQQD